MTKKVPTTICINGLSLTPLKQQEVAQALYIALAHQLNGETEGVTITFEEAS